MAQPSGLDNMSLDGFIALFRREADPSRMELNIMPWTYYEAMTDRNLGAIYAYLQSVPAIECTP
jgi:hypothetical protein